MVLEHLIGSAKEMVAALTPKRVFPKPGDTLPNTPGGSFLVFEPLLEDVCFFIGFLDEFFRIFSGTNIQLFAHVARFT